MITIVKGDDTAANGKTIRLALPETDIGDGFEIGFELFGIDRRGTYGPGVTLDFDYSRDETAAMPLGVAYGRTYLMKDGLMQTISNTVPVRVTDCAAEAGGGSSGGAGANAIRLDVTVNTGVPHVDKAALTKASSVADIKSLANALLEAINGVALCALACFAPMWLGGAEVSVTKVGGDDITGSTEVLTGVAVTETDPTVPAWAKGPEPPRGGMETNDVLAIVADATNGIPRITESEYNPGWAANADYARNAGYVNAAGYANSAGYADRLYDSSDDEHHGGSWYAPRTLIVAATNAIPRITESEYSPGWAENADVANYADSAGVAGYAESADYARNAGYADNAGDADYAYSAESADRLHDATDKGHHDGSWYAPRTLLADATNDLAGVLTGELRSTARAATNYTDSATNALAVALRGEMAGLDAVAAAKRDKVDMTVYEAVPLGWRLVSGALPQYADDLAVVEDYDGVRIELRGIEVASPIAVGDSDTRIEWDFNRILVPQVFSEPPVAERTFGMTNTVDRLATTSGVVRIVRDLSLGGIWDEALQVWWTPRMVGGSLTYQATTNVNLNAEGNQ